MKKRILITGGAGFIGSSLAASHLEQGHQVWAVDSLATGSLNNIKALEGTTGWRFDQADIREWTLLCEAVQWADWIFHMASSVGQRFVLKHPVNTLTNNIDCCKAVLKAMETTSSKARVLIASTSEVYIHSTESSKGKVSETVQLGIVSGSYLQGNYPVSKLVDEVMALSYLHEKGIDCVIARIFNTIGGNQTSAYGMVVPNFIEQAIGDKPITVYGDGLQSRSFSNINDTISALDLLLATPASKGEIVNVGDDRECTIIDLAKLIKQKANSKSEICYMPYKEAYGVDFVDVRRRQPDLQKLKKLTGFSPKWSLEQTIESIIHQKRALNEARN